MRRWVDCQLGSKDPPFTPYFEGSFGEVCKGTPFFFEAGVRGVSEGPKQVPQFCTHFGNCGVSTRNRASRRI